MNRLRAYRFIEGISQEELGQVLGISTAMVSAIESGRRHPSADLRKLGYAPERLVLPNMSPPLHRQKSSTRVQSRRRAQELIRLAGEVFVELRSRTGKIPLALERFPPPTNADELDEVVMDVRASLNVEDNGPIRNLTATVERAGVCIVPISNLMGMDGLSSWVEGVPVIGISPNIPGDRFRMTLGHELGHLLLHVRSNEQAEREAFRFASALLFPSDEFAAAMPPRPQLRNFIALKASWGVAVSALVYRAHDLEFIDDRRYRALQIQMSKWRKSEPGGFDPAHGQLLSRLVEISGGAPKVATNLGVNQSHLEELLHWSHLRVA